MGKYIYQTTFNLTNPVNNLRDARYYLQEDDMTVYLKDYVELTDPSVIEHIEWSLSDDISGKITLTTTQELTKEQLDEISEWISGQCSDGLGEGFEQQDFAAVSEEGEDDEGWPYSDVYDCASFDWQTNDYKLKLIQKTGLPEAAPTIPEADRCCENCKYYVYDDSTGTSECSCPDEYGTKWVKHNSPLDADGCIDFWNPAYDRCDKWVQMEQEPSIEDEFPDFFEEEKSLIDKVIEAKSTLHIRAILEKYLMESDHPTERNPLKVDCPRGEYWLWSYDDGTILGSAEKPDPSKNIVDARATIDFTRQGFETLDDVIEYVKKYF